MSLSKLIGLSVFSKTDVSFSQLLILSVTIPILKMPVTETLMSFLERKRVQGSDRHTHYSVGTTKADNGKYYIGEDELDLFWNLYYDWVEVQRNKIWLIEAPTPLGPMRVDLDFAYDSSVKTNQHTKEQIVQFAKRYVSSLRSFVNVPEDLNVYVMDKKRPTLKKDGSVSSGIHMVIPDVKTNRYVELAVREALLPHMDEIFHDLPLKEKNWDKVYDAGVAKRTCGWSMYGSSKPGGLPYLVSHVLKLTSDDIEDVDCDTDISVEMLTKFNTRTLDKSEETPYTEMGKERFKELPETSDNIRISGGNAVVPQRGRPAERRLPGSRDSSPAQLALRPLGEEEREHIKCHVKNLNPERARAHNDRYLVIQTLKNIHPDLYDIFEDFFRQIPDEFTLAKCISQWNEAKFRNEGQRTGMGTLLFWSRNDNPEKYKEIQERNVNNKIDCSIAGTEYDVASVVYARFSDVYKCVSFGKNVWYKFTGHVWHELDKGIQLQQELSTVIWQLYHKRASFYADKINNNEVSVCSHGKNERQEDSCQCCEVEEQEESLRKICTKLKTTKFKENVMKECRELFLDEAFVKKVDENRHLLACSNGVFDMQEMKFRDGKQEDYLSFSTNMDIDPEKHYSEYPAWHEVDGFIQKVLPNPIVRDYFIKHISRSLDGVGNQRFHILTGSGSNGKSMLMNLVETALGDYACKVPISMITQGRNKSSAASPEVIRLKGRRFVTMQEPDEAVPINTGLMKEITSSEKVLARDLYAGTKSMLEFELQCKFHLACNEKPKVNTTDGGTWRRLVVINFLSKFVVNPTKTNEYRLDSSIETKVKSESWGRAFLAYLIHVYKENAGREITPPDVVMEYTSEYREENDAITKVIREETRPAVDGEVVIPVRRDTLNDMFMRWWQSNRGTRDWKTAEMHKTIEQIYGKYPRGGWKSFQLQQDDEE